MLMEFSIFLLIIIIVFHYFTRCGRTGTLVKNMPGVPAWPLIGSLPSLIVPQDEIWPMLRKFNDDYYPIFKFWTTHEVVINIRHPDDIEILLSSTQHIDKSKVYQLLQPWLGTGLVTSTGKKWQERRKILTPAFHFNILKEYSDTIAANNEILVESLTSRKGDILLKNLQKFISDHTLKIICETAMGTPSNVVKGIQNEYREAIYKMGEIVVHRLCRPWLHTATIFGLTKTGREQANVLKILHGFSRKIIRERRKEHKETEEKCLNELIWPQIVDGKTSSDEEMQSEFRRKRLAMLDLLIASSKTETGIDESGIQEEVDTFIFEGHDTAAAGLTFALLLLAEHKAFQDRARAEVNEIFERLEVNRLGYTEIAQLHYLEMCIKESLRLYPSVPFISRKLGQDLQLSKYLIPAGAIVHVHIYDLHRDANFWTEPNKFDPERFSPDTIGKRHPYSYIPFSAGPRNCIGQRFAMMELKATIAYLLRNFYLEPIDLAHEIPIVVDLVLRPARPIQMKLIPINN
ncbi:hypothetical protein QAD02_001926 [Eretmocerus hayati]|uniref:Uncharacterized protein n=1 Tax=Eretmocerus hayati TaxID=131215 RepID=A0ACC2NHT9_9HYME|nr:hypothetical protein QAD02_001926 [Eretmocerus hayati]